MAVTVCAGVLLLPAAAARVTPDDLARLVQARDQGSLSIREQFVEVISRMEATDRADLLLDIMLEFADQRFAEGASEASLPAVEAALILAKRSGDLSRVASLDAMAGQMQYAMKRTPQARARIEAAIQQQRHGGRPLELARQLNSYSSLLNEVEEFGLAMRLSDEALRLVTRHAGERLSVLSFGVLYSRVELLRAVGDLAGSLAAAESLLSRAQRGGNRQFIGTALHALGRSALSMGERKRAADAFETSYYTAREFGDTFGQFLTAMERASLALDDGELGTLSHWLTPAAALRGSVDDVELRGRYDLLDATLLARQSRPVVARQALERARAQIGATRALWLQAALRSTEAEVLATEGKPREALAMMRESVALSRKSERAWWRNAIAAREAAAAAGSVIGASAQAQQRDTPAGTGTGAGEGVGAGLGAGVTQWHPVVSARTGEPLGIALAGLAAGMLMVGAAWVLVHRRRTQRWPFVVRLPKRSLRDRRRRGGDEAGGVRADDLRDAVHSDGLSSPGPDTAAVFALDRRRAQKEHDKLTRVSTSAALKAIADELLERAARIGRPMSIVLLHLDDLGELNRAEGFERGNALLKLVASTLRRVVRNRDRIGRWEGDEFVVILNRADDKAAKDAAARLHSVIQDALRDGGFPTVSCSVGVATVAAGESFNRTLARADTAMNQARQAGRNQVFIAA